MLGIDLGTSNISAAFTGEDPAEAISLPMIQLAGLGRVMESPLLPSALYVPLEQEVQSGGTKLPWSDDPLPVVIGEYARSRSSEMPDRVVTSAKSWLCNSHVDRRSAILPWRSEVPHKYSPLDISRVYLEHVRAVLAYAESSGRGQAPRLEDGIVLTVPASFDEVARSLTHEAAVSAGFENVTLLEEPLAAFYSWIALHAETWRNQVEPGDIVLVADVGGGTADFSLVAVAEHDGELALERIAVGDHILLGGDNMDLALAFNLRGELEAAGTELDHWQFLSLVHSTRIGKEKILGSADFEEIPISIASKGAGLFAAAISTKLTREMVHRVILEGFFPLCGSQDHPVEQTQGGLQEFGLPYAADPALSKHLAAFLARSRKNVSSDERLGGVVEKALERHDSLLLPTKVLFNGGVFNAPVLKQRVLELLQSWAQTPVTELGGASLDLAVSRGAAYYGGLRARGERLRIRSGTARSYYLGLEQSMPAVPGYRPPIKGVCVVPQGMEEGSEERLGDREFGLVTGYPVRFRFFSSNVRAGDQVGTIVDKAERELEETAQLELTSPLADQPAGEVVPVELHSRITELGVLELWMHHTRSEQRWKLEFDVRAKES